MRRDTLSVGAEFGVTCVKITDPQRGEVGQRRKPVRGRTDRMQDVEGTLTLDAVKN